MIAATCQVAETTGASHYLPSSAPPGVSLLPNLSRSKRFCPLSPSFPTSCLWGVGGWFISELIYRMLLMSSWWAVTRVNGCKGGKIQLTLQLAGQWLICIKSGGKRSAMYRQPSCLISAQSAGTSEGEACEHIVWIADRPSGSRLVGRCRCWSYRPRRFSIKWGGVSTDPIWGGAGQECAGYPPPPLPPRSKLYTSNSLVGKKP